MKRGDPTQGTNLEQFGQNFRLRLGVMMLAIALVGTIAMVQGGLHRGWRLLLFLPFFMASSGAWQGLFRTCPGHAFKGVRENAAGGEDRVARRDELQAARHLARLVLFGSAATALVLTAIVMMVP